jgi:hypothetical protein
MLGADTHERGARACVGMIDIGDIAAELADFDIHWQVTEERGR